MNRHYVTTAIDFPNAAPHMGHVMEKILADVVVRWLRLRGDEVRFHIGTDENGIKIQQTAKTAGVTPRELVDRNAPLFKELFKCLHISFDYFIRTSDPKTHWPTVIELWKRLRKADALEKRTYTGLYCSGCERFMTKKDLVEGKCPHHLTAPQEVTEENWFFRLKEQSRFLHDLLTRKDGYHIVPEFRAQETLSFLGQGLEDVSFSRSKETLSWGVPVPDDPSQIMYVWCDNLTSYISSLGYFTDHAMTEWWDGAEVTHVIGKDIARFHALNWPAMLHSASVKTPNRLLIHGFLNMEGQKMSKSLGNVVAPEDILAKFGGNPDPLRFFLSHEIPVGRDGDFSWRRLEELYDSRLRNAIGNLLNRVIVLLRKHDGGVANVHYERWPTPHAQAMHLQPRFADAWKTYSKTMNDFELNEALQYTLVTLADFANQLIDIEKPWSIKEKDTSKFILSVFAETLRHISLMLLPFIPTSAQTMSKQLGVPYADRMLEKDFVMTDGMRQWGGCPEWKRVGEPSILFPPLA